MGVEFGEGLDLGVEFGDWIWGLDFWVGFWGFAIDSKLIFHALSAIRAYNRNGFIWGH